MFLDYTDYTVPDYTVHAEEGGKFRQYKVVGEEVSYKRVVPKHRKNYPPGLFNLPSPAVTGVSTFELVDHGIEEPGAEVYLVTKIILSGHGKITALSCILKNDRWVVFYTFLDTVVISDEGIHAVASYVFNRRHHHQSLDLKHWWAEWLKLDAIREIDTAVIAELQRAIDLTK